VEKMGDIKITEEIDTKVNKFIEEYNEGKNEPAIISANDLIKLYPEWGDIYALRGQCSDSLGCVCQAMRDYCLAKNRELSENLKPFVDRRIEELSKLEIPMPKQQVLYTDEKTASVYCEGYEPVESYIKALWVFYKSLPNYPEIAEWDNDNILSKDMDMVISVMIKNPERNILLGIDREGFFIANENILIDKTKSHPKRKYYLYTSFKNSEEGKTKQLIGNLHRRLARLTTEKSPARDIMLEKKREYSRNNTEANSDAEKYIKTHKPDIHFKDKVRHMLKHSGISRQYTINDNEKFGEKVMPDATETTVYHKLIKER
jgi:hypothetical protein